MYYEAFDNEKLESWQAGIVHALEDAGGVPRAISFDNARALVASSDDFFGTLNAAMHDICNYYSMYPHTNKAYSPTYKCETERGAGLAETHIIAKLKNRGPIIVKDLAELNVLIKKLTKEINDKPFTNHRKASCRTWLFETYEKPALRPLPHMRYEICKWQRATTDSYGVLTVDRARYNVKEGWQSKRLVVKLDFNKVTIYDPESFQCVGEHKRDWSHTYERHMKKEYMNDWGKFMSGDPEAVDRIMQQHGITDRHESIRTFIKIVRDRLELVNAR